MFADDLAEALARYYRSRVPVEKSKAVRDLSGELGLEADGKLFVQPERRYAVRFAYSAKGTFSNTVLALSKLLKYDGMPVIVCLLMPGSYALMLANTTFLRKISHSSHALTLTNIKGSFLGNDILREVEMDGVGGAYANAPANFERLFAYHREQDPAANLERLVRNTSRIEAAKPKFPVDAEVRRRIHESIRFSFREHARIGALREQLDRQVAVSRSEILHAAAADAANVNLRGNRIEQLITGDVNRHGLADVVLTLPEGGRVCIDIKTSLAGKSSNPKLYNVDKQLEALSDGRTACMLYFVHLDPERDRVSTYLVNAFDAAVIAGTRLQFHWAGRDSRGVTQLDMNIQRHFEDDWQEHLDVAQALQFVDRLIDGA